MQSLNTAFYALNLQPSPHYAQTTSSDVFEWLPEAGAISHMTSDLSTMESVQSYQGSSQVVVGNGSNLPVSHTGTLNFFNPTHPLYLKDILIVPQITTNILYVAKFVKDDMCLIEFNLFGNVVKDFITKTLLLKGPIRNNLSLMQIPTHFKNHLVFAARPMFSYLWHQPIGHPCD